MTKALRPFPLLTPSPSFILMLLWLPMGIEVHAARATAADSALTLWYRQPGLIQFDTQPGTAYLVQPSRTGPNE